MQDSYVGDIGDYGKYGLLREINSIGLSLSVNWYRTVPSKAITQDDGKYTSYLTKPHLYRAYDPLLFDTLYEIVYKECNRQIARIENSDLLQASFFTKEVSKNRSAWHHEAFAQTTCADVVFLDPDNGLETLKMHQSDNATQKHVKWSELKDYYQRGQTVILYQHRPQMMPKEQCIKSIMTFQTNYLHADNVMLLEFPKFTNRFYFMFIHNNYKQMFQNICSSMTNKWGKDNFCREIVIQ